MVVEPVKRKRGSGSFMCHATDGVYDAGEGSVVNLVRVLHKVECVEVRDCITDDYTTKRRGFEYPLC